MNNHSRKIRKLSLSTAIVVLDNLITTIENTGGVLVNDSNRVVGLVTDKEWLDLAHLYLAACELRRREPMAENQAGASVKLTDFSPSE